MYTYDRFTERNIIQLLKFAIEHSDWSDPEDLAKKLGCDPDWIEDYWEDAISE